jgi:hypothetical protein
MTFLEKKEAYMYMCASSQNSGFFFFKVLSVVMEHFHSDGYT